MPSIGRFDLRQILRRGALGRHAHGGGLHHAPQILQVAQELGRSGRHCDCHMMTSGSNQFHWSGSSTRVPTLGPLLTSPLAISDFTASRTTVRLTPSSSHSMGSGGMGAPGP